MMEMLLVGIICLAAGIGLGIYLPMLVMQFRHRNVRLLRAQVDRVFNEIRDHALVVDRNLRPLASFGPMPGRGTLPEISGTLGRAMGDPEDSRLHEDMFRRALAGGPVFYRWKCQGSESEPNWRSTQVIPFWNREGSITALAAVSHDIGDPTRIEESLHVSEQQFRGIFHRSPVPILLSSFEDGTVLYANDSFSELTGYRAEDLVGRKTRDLNLWHDPQVRPEISRSLRDRQVIKGLESTIMASNGEMKRTLASLQIVEIDGRPLVLRVDTDVTEREKAEIRLREREEKFRSLVDALRDSVTVLDKDLRQVEIYDHSPGRQEDSDQEIGKTPSESAGPERGLIHEEKGRIALAGQPVTYEWSWKDEEKGTVHYRTSLSPIWENDRPSGLVSVSEDVTDLRNAVIRAEQNESRFRSLVDSMEDLVLVLDKSLRVNAVYGSWPRRHQIDPDSFIGKTLSEICTREGAPLAETPCCASMAGETTRYECLLSLNGISSSMHVSASPLKGEGDEANQMLLVCRDISAMKEAESQLRLREEQLRHAQRVDALGRLAGGIAHDFNNILTIINGYCDLALDNPSVPDSVRRCILEISQAGERASSLTSQLLAFGRRQILQPQVINLNDVINEMSDMLQRLIGEYIDLVVKLGPDLGNTKADPGQVGQMIMNLAINGRDAMPSGGKLLIETGNVELTADYVRWHTEIVPGPYVMLTISDNGKGMDQTTASRAFEPFFTTKEKGQGTGLGLATVYGIVRQSGGHILLYSEPGRGTTAKVYLPRTDAPEKPATTERITDNLRGSETILIAEDESHIRHLAAQALRNHGYRVITASDGQQAIALYERNQGKVDLLLTDVVMPGISGPDLARDLSSLGMKGKVLFMSGYSNAFLRELSGLGNSSDFLQKPFKPDTLVRSVRALLDESAS